MGRRLASRVHELPAQGVSDEALATRVRGNDRSKACAKVGADSEPVGRFLCRQVSGPDVGARDLVSVRDPVEGEEPGLNREGR